VNHIEWGGKRDLNVVQLTGGMRTIEGTDTNILTTMLSERLGGKPLLLHAPLLVRDPQTKEAFLREERISEALSAARSVDVALLGIGLADKKGSLWKTGLLREKDYRVFKKHGAVGAICGRFYDINGNPCVTGWDRRVIGLTLEELSRVKHKVGIAIGREKREALLGALRGHFLNVLITDESTAQTLLKIKQN
jgi:DNA-binding transcriptional regulator LsrR (DeoR family)